jgi:polyphosphate kinase 2 (PPK2 family)
MFESIEDTQPIDKQDYETRLPSLRVDLINAQYDLSQADFPLLIVIAGNDRVGCNDVVQTLHEWMDARYIETEFFGQLTKAERERPRFWRYWRALPPKGRTAIFFGAWPLNLMADRLTRRIGHHAFAARLDFARAFERTLTDDGVVLLKFWLHLPKKKLHKRLRQARKHPDKRWRVEDRDWTPYELYDESLPVVEEVIRGTDDEHAPWRLIDSSDARTRNLAIAESIRRRFRFGRRRKWPTPLVPFR